MRKVVLQPQLLGARSDHVVIVIITVVMLQHMAANMTHFAEALQHQKKTLILLLVACALHMWVRITIDGEAVVSMYRSLQ